MYIIDDGLTREYQRGFADGEKQSREDRLAGTLCDVSEQIPLDSEYGRGYLDGYTPRTWAWAHGRD
jgi:hypothetical protein